jgi:hypothetical protein
LSSFVSFVAPFTSSGSPFVVPFIKIYKKLVTTKFS